MVQRNKLKALYTLTAPGTPLTSEDLNALGISADLAVHYARAGWLTRLARGVYSRPNDPLTLDASLVLLQRQIEALHVGGKSALDWYGVRHYLSERTDLHLYGWKAARLPAWFTEIFPAEYHRKRLFDEQPDRLLYVTGFEKREGAPQVATPERALLEMLSEVGVRQPLQEARELVESTYSLRADVLRDLLQHCANVKTVRLCLQLGRELALPGRPSSILRTCRPGATNPGCPAPPTACWCSNHESRLSRKYVVRHNHSGPFCRVHLPNQILVDLFTVPFMNPATMNMNVTALHYSHSHTM